MTLTREEAALLAEVGAVMDYGGDRVRALLMEAMPLTAADLRRVLNQIKEGVTC